MEPDFAELPQLHCLGLNYRTSSLEVREKFSVSRKHLALRNAELAALPGVEECVLLSTCNRTELYYWTHDAEAAHSGILAHMLGCVPCAGEISACFYRYAEDEALEHLACVAAGLDSMVVGETEIFGQLKDAYRAAQEAATTSTCANRTFQRIFSIGKKVRSETRITSGPTSVGAVAVMLAQRVLGGLAGANVLVVGAGEIARSTAQSLCSRGAESIFVANRSYDRAVALAEQVGGRVIRFAEWVPYLEQIDIVIVSTASPVYVVSPSVLQGTQQTREGRPLFLIDLSVPRNVDPACSRVQGVHVYDMDDLQAMVADTRRLRGAEIAGGEKLVHEWVLENAPDLLRRKRFASS
ncbi:MAG: glutamyl-tRNA reductase [Akkermansia sp.]|nr:glutamyl-tRNA reductase [Akkermansia sp.]